MSYMFLPYRTGVRFRAVRRDGLSLAGWVANEPGERMSCYAENLDTLKQLLPAPFLGEVPRISPWDPKGAADFLSIGALLR